MGYPSIFVFTVEIFPTAIRSIGMGCSSAIGGLGAMLAAFIADLNKVHDWIPPVTFGVMMTLAVLAILVLPETKGRILPELVEDVNDLMEQDTINILKFCFKKKSSERY